MGEVDIARRWGNKKLSIYLLVVQSQITQRIKVGKNFLESTAGPHG